MNFFCLFKILITSAFCTTLFFSVPLNADFGWSDAGHHAIDGVFYRDLILEAGFINPVEYAKTYYQHYPAITPVMYPPFFALAESLFFSVFGIHAWAARATVIFFLGLGAWGLMKLTEELLGQAGSFFAGLIYIAFPLVLYWSRDVMLESAAMALIVWSFYGLLNFIKYHRMRDICICLISATLAPYTKQNTIFIFPVFIFSAVIAGRASHLFDRRFLSGILISALCGIPLIYVTLTWGHLNLTQSFGNLMESRSFVDHAFYYFFVLPESIGWPFIMLSCLGLFLSINNLYKAPDASPSINADSDGILFKKFKKKWKTVFTCQPELALFLGWAVICYLQMAVIRIKEPRHGFFWMPLFAILSAFALQQLLSRFSSKEYRTVIAGTLIIGGVFGYNIAHCKMNWSEGFHDAAVYLTENWKGEGILTNVYGDSSLIFHIRALDSQRKYRVYRCLKVFESMMIYKDWHKKTLLHSQDAFIGALSRWGVRYVLIEEPVKNMTPAESIIRKAVKGAKFVRVKTFPVVYPDNVPAKLHLYRYLGKTVKNPTLPDIHLPVVGEVIQGGA